MRYLARWGEPPTLPVTERVAGSGARSFGPSVMGDLVGRPLCPHHLPTDTGGEAPDRAHQGFTRRGHFFWGGKAAWSDQGGTPDSITFAIDRYRQSGPPIASFGSQSLGLAKAEQGFKVLLCG
jgi:hypothetical protein